MNRKELDGYIKELYAKNNYAGIVELCPPDADFLDGDSLEIRTKVVWSWHHNLKNQERDKKISEDTAAHVRDQILMVIGRATADFPDDPELVDIEKLLPLTLADLGPNRIDDALAEYERLAKKYSENGDLMTDKVVLLVKIKKFEEALLEAVRARGIELFLAQRNDLLPVETKRHLRFAGNLARWIAICSKELFGAKFGIGWLDVAIANWCDSESEGWKASNHINGALELRTKWLKEI